MIEHLKRWRDNPKTTIFGVAQLVGSIWYMIENRHLMKPEQLMNPETFLPIGFVISGLAAILGADARRELKPSEIKEDTTLIGEK